MKSFLLVIKSSLPASILRISLSSFVAVLTISLLAGGASTLQAQSTFGSIQGTVHDSTGANVAGATVLIVNLGTSAQRTVITGDSGDFILTNIDVGKYSLTVTASGFEKYSLPEISLTARESRRVDATLQLGAESQTVTVQGQLENVITTDVSNLAVTKTGDELVDLPVAIYSRSAGSTSPISTLTTEAGVQTDDSGNLTVAGTTPALLSVTIDGISSVGVEYSGPVNEMFPSFNSIEEIRVSESNNNAEFSGVADITTVSRPGTGKFHGGAFENLENTVFNSGVPVAFASSKPKIIMNDFGGTFGGPVILPRLYNGKERTFFFTSFEGLRLPRETPILVSVPSLDMRAGNLTDYLNSQGISAICTPSAVVCTPSSPYVITNTSAVPVNAITGKILSALFPTPNLGAANSYSNNYQENFPAPISANQGDVRLDQTLTSKQSIFGRFSYKNRQVTSAPDTGCTFAFCQTAGGILQGGYNLPEIDEGMTFAHNYVITPNVLNEFRGGFNAQHTSTNQSFSTSALLNQTGLNTVPQPDLQWSEAPQVLINGLMATGGGNPTRQRGQIIQALDNVNWTKGHHTFKFGGDWKRLSDHDDNVFGNYRSGWYVFDGSSNSTFNIADTGDPNVGDPYTEFIEGYPDYTEAATVRKPTMDGVGYSWAFFGQDDWKITPNLTLNLGLRYELHPPLKETNYNTAFFLPDYTGSVSGGQTVHGAVVVPNTQAESFESTDFENAIAPTPTLTAKQAGIPETLRYTDKNDWGPRLGFAWRPYGNDKTVVRGGWGRFIETPLGFSLVSGWAVHASYVGVFNQSLGDDNITPQLSFQSPFPPQTPGSATGTAGFYYAFPIHYKDPSVQQWNLTVEQDLGHNIGMRLSYIGSHGKNLEEMVDLNQVPANTQGYYNTSAQAPVNPATNSCITDDGSLVADHRPYPCWSVIQSVENLGVSNYNSGTVEVSRHSGKNLTFDASYAFTRDISDAAGATPSAFVSSGGNFLTDRFHPKLDNGNVAYDRKHRFLVTYLYDLPFGKGQRWLNSGSALNVLVGDWHLGGVTILQSGPFLTPYETSNDPAGTNILTTVGQTRSDLIPHMPIYPQHRTASEWLVPPPINPGDPPSAFSVPNANRGYFGTAAVGSIVGPGTDNFSMSLRKDITLHEQTKFELSLEAANVFNHRNYEPPNMQVDATGVFGTITALQTAEGAGPRSLELAARISF
jgi:hypothetical protein